MYPSVCVCVCRYIHLHAKRGRERDGHVYMYVVHAGREKRGVLKPTALGYNPGRWSPAGRALASALIALRESKREERERERERWL